MLSRVLQTSHNYLRDGFHYLSERYSALDSPYKTTAAGIVAGTMYTGVNSAGAIVFTTTLAGGTFVAREVKRVTFNSRFQLEHLDNIEACRIIAPCISSKVSEKVLLPLDPMRCALGFSLTGIAVRIGKLILTSDSRTPTSDYIGISLIYNGVLLCFNTVTAASLLGLQALGVIGDCDDAEASAVAGTTLAMLTIAGLEAVINLSQRQNVDSEQ